jgi:hypothetical protein
LELNKRGLDRTLYIRALSNIYEAYFEERFRPIKDQVDRIEQQLKKEILIWDKYGPINNSFDLVEKGTVIFT